MKNKNEVTIRSSAAEYLTYIASVGDSDRKRKLVIQMANHTLVAHNTLRKGNL